MRRSWLVTRTGETQRKADREAGTDLAHRMAAGERLTETDVEAELVVNLPDRPDQTRDRAGHADLVLYEELGDRSHLPLDRSFDDRAEEEVGVVIARQRGLAVEIDRAPVVALRNDAGNARAQLVAAVAVGQQQPELGRDARPGLVLQDTLAQHVLEERAVGGEDRGAGRRE